MAESDLIRGNVDTVILKVLYEGDRYGYDLIKQINARGDGQWEIKQPTVYACLKRLEKQGFVTSYWDSSESDGGRRKYYSLTESGKERVYPLQKRVRTRNRAVRRHYFGVGQPVHTIRGRLFGRRGRGLFRTQTPLGQKTRQKARTCFRTGGNGDGLYGQSTYRRRARIYRADGSSPKFIFVQRRLCG